MGKKGHNTVSIVVGGERMKVTRKARLEAESAARRAEEKREEESRTPRELTPHACEWGCKFTGSFDEVVRHEATCKLKVNNVHAYIP